MDIEIEDLSIGYGTGRQLAVVARGLCGSVRGGELTCLLGANGVGKSTLLRTLSAFQPKAGGSVRVGGREIDAYTPKELARVVSVVLTEKPDISNMTARELVSMGRAPYTGFWGRESDADGKIVDEAMRMTGISALAGRLTDTLSDGERQKVMIAKALAQQTPVIILDEPTAFLDFPSKVETTRLLRTISHTTGKAVLMSTHDLDLALQMADVVWLLDKTRGVTAGAPEDLSLDGSLAAFFADEGITFDAAAGLFRSKDETTAAVRLCGGDGAVRRMAAKALRRSGIAATDREDCRVSVTVSPGAYAVSAGGVTTEARDIYNMLKEVSAALRGSTPATPGTQ